MAKLRGLAKATQNQSERLILIEQGRHAQVAIAYSEGVIRSLEENIILYLLNKHRSGSLTEAEMRGKVGEIAGFRNLIHALRTDIKNAHIAQEEEMKGGN